MIRSTAVLAAALCMGWQAVHADDGRGLQRGGNAQEVSLSGVSSGAAMAVQYAVAHSSAVVGVGAIAGPGWGCADGRVSTAINDCMCGRNPVTARTDAARALATGADAGIDPLVSGKPRALQRAYVFHSAADRTVTPQSGAAAIAFLAAFTGQAPVVDQGSANDGSDRAGHGIVSPDGTDSCVADGQETTYIRHCGAADNAGKLFLALYGQGAAYDAGKRVSNIPASEVWRFDQQGLIDEVKKDKPLLASDRAFLWWPYRSARRANFDLAGSGYLYVPPACRRADSQCRVHIALHGCKQDARTFAIRAGYNNWAEHYKVIVVYPAIMADAPVAGEVCPKDPIPPAADLMSFEPNPNACWDWWGYLDTGWPEKARYLTRKAPQMQVIERIIAALTRPLK